MLRFLSSGIAVASKEEPFTLAALGIVAFDHVDLIETLPPSAQDPLGFPDFVFWLAESLVVFEPGARPRAICTAFGSDDAKADERAYFGATQRLADLVARCGRVAPVAYPPKADRPADFSQTDLDDDAYAAVVARMKGHIAEGEVYQIVPSRTFRAPCADPLRSYAALRALDPSPYHFFVAAPDHVVFGASPETSVRVYGEKGAGHKVEVKPIAGTRPRGLTGDEDDRLEAEMRLDAKEAAEHMMLVDLARNDVARVSVAGTRRVEKLLGVERYARVMHLVSSVTGALKPGMDALDALQACLNVGTLTGAPKIRATQLLRETEVTKRGPYGGAIGWINGEGMMDTAVVIRTAVVKDGTAFVRAGAGIVHDSDPASRGGGDAAQGLGFALGACRDWRGGMTRNVLFIDNFDTFTFNLVESFERLGCEIAVLRNNIDAGRGVRARAAIECADRALAGAGKAARRGLLPRIDRAIEGQGATARNLPWPPGDRRGGRRHRRPRAGARPRQVLLLDHDGQGPLRGLDTPLSIGRYHSLCTRDLPARFRIHAEIDGMAMAISDPEARQTGLQFHPESILTLRGDAILRNVLEDARD